jgi:hypothetical protein
MILKFLVEILGFVCVCILSHLSKNNPFEEQLIDNLSNYFNFTDEINTKNNKYNNIFIKRVSAKNHILNGSKTLPSDLDINKKLFLRKLVSHSFCSEMYDKFEKYRGTKFSNIFDLNYDKIHKYSIITLILSLVNFISKVILRISIPCVERDSVNNILIFFCAIFLWFIIFLDSIKLIFSAFIFYFMEKGDIEKYIDFLECQNVNANFFKNISDVNRIRECFFIFVFMEFISLGIEKVDKNIEKFGNRENYIQK